MTEQPSTTPTSAGDAFEQAAANLRQAEQGWADSRVSAAMVGQIVDIANAWTALGVGLSNMWPLRRVVLGGDAGEDEYRTRSAHMWPTTGLLLCVRCGVGAENAHTPCVLVDMAKVREALDKHAAANPPHEHDNNCHHAFIRPMDPCANGCGTRPSNVKLHDPKYCNQTCPDVTA